MAKYENGQEIYFTFHMSLGDLIDCGGIDNMNDIADNAWKEQVGENNFILTDIGYNILSSTSGESGPSNIVGDVTIEVCAVLEEID